MFVVINTVHARLVNYANAAPEIKLSVLACAYALKELKLAEHVKKGGLII